MAETQRPAVSNGDPIDPADVVRAMTTAPFTYADGATQVFTPDGRTTFTENGSRSPGEWGVDGDGRFWSFWPPSYRATYDVSWMLGPDGDVVGVRFTEVNGRDAFVGTYVPGRRDPS